MNWLDYREKLGVGFNDEGKFSYFLQRSLNYLRYSKSVNTLEYFTFCDITGSQINRNLEGEYRGSDRYAHILEIITHHSNNIREYLAYVIAYINVISDQKQRLEVIEMMQYMLSSSKISYDVVNDDNEIFIFPKGAAELDDALVSEPLEWLSAYPSGHKAFVKALHAYADATSDNASDVADLFRKALEAFCQDFFESKKSLENLKSDIGTYLKENGVPVEISSNVETTLQAYTRFINNYAKHRDATSDKLLEYIMYQTGNIIRLMIVLKTEELTDAH